MTSARIGYLRRDGARCTRVERLHLAGGILVLAAVLAIAGAVYYWAEWHRMAQTCQPHGTSTTLDYSHSWTRGFICASGDGHQQAKFFW